ncbi:MAG: type II secretion system protein N [Desulfobulbus sp.]
MLSIVIRLIVITILVFAGVRLWYGGVEKRLQEQAPPAKVVQQDVPAEAVRDAAPHTAPGDEIPIILSRNIFQATRAGGTAADSEQPESDIEHLAQTQLSLSLLGTVTGGREDARAIIRDDKTKLEDLYRVGSEIQGAIVQRITRGKVVLLVNGRDEVLVIKDREEGGGPVNRNVGQRLPVAINEPEEKAMQPIPRAVPRRRISFRSSAAPPPPVTAAPRETDIAPEEAVQSDANQAVPGPPQSEANPPEQETEQAAEAPEN